MGCHFCEDAFFSSEGWKKHNSQKHRKTNRSEYIPEDAVEPGTYVPSSAAALPTDLILAEVKEEEKTAIEQAAWISSGVDLDVEPEFTKTSWRCDLLRCGFTADNQNSRDLRTTGFVFF